MKSTNVFFNVFTLQTLISNIPTVVVSGILPMFAYTLGFTTAQIGILFLLARMGAVVGAQLGPHVLSAFRGRVYLACTFNEFFNALISLSFLVAVVYRWPWALYGIVFAKGVGIGLMPNLRVTWLKNFTDALWAKRVLLISQVIVQVAYGVVGLLLLFGLNWHGALWVLVSDAATSIAGIFLFLFFSDRAAAPTEHKKTFGDRLTGIFQKDYRSLWLADIFLSLAMGGTNIFLVRSGAELFKSSGGYGLSLCLYAFAYLVGGLVVQSVLKPVVKLRERAQTLLPSLMIAAFAAMVFHSLSFPAFALLFALYPMVLLNLEGTWFTNLTTDEIAFVSAQRAFVLHCLWALGEALYPLLPFGTELIVRAVFVGLAGLAFRALP